MLWMDLVPWLNLWEKNQDPKNQLTAKRTNKLCLIQVLPSVTEKTKRKTKKRRNNNQIFHWINNIQQDLTEHWAKNNLTKSRSTVPLLNNAAFSLYFDQTNLVEPVASDNQPYLPHAIRNIQLTCKEMCLETTMGCFY